MTKRTPRAPKAYRNQEFLSGPDARAIRILAEFIEPLHRFRRSGVRDTIVFFGSARIKSRGEALRNFKQFSQTAQKQKQLSSSLEKKLHNARSVLELSKYYEDAVKLSRLLTKWSKKLKGKGRLVVCSGGGPGIMEAANKGARLAKGNSIGLNISLPFEQNPNDYISRELNFEFHYFFMRKFWFMYLAKAFVMFPGGFGTLDEMMEVLTLLQTNKIKKKVTVVLYGRAYWEEVLNFEALVHHGVISREDLKLFVFKDTPEEAFEYLVKELRKNYAYETEEI
ncbi:MAG: TIGR00730 family Rossman fold protein [Ignavibacteriae bacterium]|nr:TIGR00730 family Rossman fold protein [Ignavibacteriota bacterium]